jgi:hypothetical protein
MVHDFSDLPNRLTPYILMNELNAPVVVARGHFRLTGSGEGTLDSDLFFRWLPSVAIAFDGSYSVPHVDLTTGSWTLQSEGALKFSAPVFVSQATLGSASSGVKGIVQGQFAVGEPSFHSLRFSLFDSVADTAGRRVRWPWRYHEGPQRTGACDGGESDHCQLHRRSSPA